MKSWRSRDTLHADLAMPLAASAAASGAAAVQGAAPPTPPPPPQPLIDWLAQLTLLYGVPFEYLVADASLLPTESLRFLYLDQNRLDRLIDGALSIATQSSGDVVFTETFFESVYQAVQVAQQTLRATLRGKPVPDTVTVGATKSGLLFRSVVVSGWPGLEVQATKANVTVDILRMDRLAPDILLVLFNGVPDTVNVVEPSEGLHLGVIDVPNQPGQYEVLLRGLGFASYPGGEQIAGPGGAYLKATTGCRTGGGQPDGVLDIDALTKNITTTMPAGALGDGNAMTSGGFAIQMVRGAGLQAFTLTAGKDCTQGPVTP
jgi:hypothetical protein